MTRPAPRIVALVPLVAKPPAAYDAPFGITTVLGHTLLRLARCETLNRIVLIHDRDTPPPNLPDHPALRERILFHQADSLDDNGRPARVAARKWSPTAWRGGLGGATCYDEPLAAGPMADALEAADAHAGLIVAPDWPLVDPALCDAVVNRHAEQPERLKLVFTQAPPGLAGCLVDRSLLIELRDKRAMIGSLLDYQPRLPQGDPIGKDPCVQIPAAIRNAQLRAVFDAPRWRRLLRHVEKNTPADRLLDLDAAAAVRVMQGAMSGVHHPLPQQVAVELNADRVATGPITPQHSTEIPGSFAREPMALDRFRRLFEQLAAEPDVAVTLGGLGDPLLHPEWDRIVQTAHDAGVNGVHIETDLLVGEDVLQRLLELPIDVVSVRLNADSAEVYQKLMGVDAFGRVMGNIEWLLNHRREAGCVNLPWIVPRMVKTAENVHELESFFDRWTYFCGHAMVEPPLAGDGPMPDLSVLDMAPPVRRGCRQLEHRMTIHADGRAALCDRDWRGRHSPGDCAEQSPADVWRSMEEIRQLHRERRFDALPLCRQCRQWHRP